MVYLQYNANFPGRCEKRVSAFIFSTIVRRLLRTPRAAAGLSPPSLSPIHTHTHTHTLNISFGYRLSLAIPHVCCLSPPTALPAAYIPTIIIVRHDNGSFCFVFISHYNNVCNSFSDHATIKLVYYYSFYHSAFIVSTRTRKSDTAYRVLGSVYRLATAHNVSRREFSRMYSRLRRKQNNRRL